jgi:hypothetical protein
MTQKSGAVNGTIAWILLIFSRIFLDARYHARYLQTHFETEYACTTSQRYDAAAAAAAADKDNNKDLVESSYYSS